MVVYMSHHVYIVMCYYVNDLRITCMGGIYSVCGRPHTGTRYIYINNNNI